MMNNKEHKAYLAEFKKWTAKVASSKEEAQAFLVSAGIYDAKKLQLSKPYTMPKR